MQTRSFKRGVIGLTLASDCLRVTSVRFYDSSKKIYILYTPNPKNM